MRAWTVDPTFGLEHLAAREVPDPQPGPGEALVEVRAVALNYRDLLMVTGAYNARQPLPLVPCSDAAGVVVALGDGPALVAVGDRVMPAFAVGWTAGPYPANALSTTLGGPLPGTLAERIVVPQAALVPMPAHLSFEEAATLPCAGVTAWHALMEAHGLRPGDRVLTQGTGGVSLFAVQIATMAGASAMVVSGSDDKLATAFELGADFGVNRHENPEWGTRAREWSQGGVDVVVELGGPTTMAQTLKAVRPGGTVAMIGNLGGSQAPLNLLPAVMRCVKLQGILVGSAAMLRALARAFEAHRLQPAIGEVFAWEGARDAFEALRAAGHVGKIVIRGPE